MFNLANTKRRKIGSSVGNLSTISDTGPSINATFLRSQSLLSLKDVSLSNSLSDWQAEKQKIDNALIEKTFINYKEAETSIYNLAKNNLILQCLKDIAKNVDKKLTQDTASKLNTIIDKWEIEKYVKLTSNIQDYNMQLLGIKNIPDAELTQMEKIRIKTCIEIKLKEKIEQLLKIYSEEGFNIDEGIKYAENGIRDRYMKKCGFEQDLLIEKITELLNKYQESIVSCYDKLYNWKELKLETMNIQLKKACNLKLQSRIIELKIKISELACISKMYNETPLTIESFQKLNAKLDDKLNLIDKEIQEKKELRKQFDSLKGTEFDVIVKNYRELCFAIDKQKQMLEKL